MPRPDLPPLGTLEPFEATVRHGSMTAAARELHVTHGAVSRQVRGLERALGVELFERGQRALVPTPAARRLAATVRDALDGIETAAREIARRPPTGPLTLSCEPTLLMRWLIPRLPDLAERAPDVTLHLVAAGGPVHFDRDGIDLAIRRDDFPFPADTHATRLFAEHVGPVHRPDAPAAGTVLHTATRPDAWDDWRRRTGEPYPAASEQTLEHFSLTLQAAASGVGTAIGPYALVHDDLARGALTAPYGFVPDGTAYHLLGRRPVESDPRTAALRDWLRSLAAEPGPS
ncbi:LysR substrate-binding domain-containing protein [Streptomyces sp. NPDC050400]|uniref:LysR substrate-binding domain-containing protein n=1 Tax=Streptomyces sp. NPDC050400 TaxID=3365610 RepID=UPI00379C1D8E